MTTDTQTPETEATEPEVDDAAAAAELEADRDAARERIRQSLALASRKVDADVETLQKSRDARRKVIDLGMEGSESGANLLTYKEMAEITGLSVAAILKIRNDGKTFSTLSKKKTAAE